MFDTTGFRAILLIAAPALLCLATTGIVAWIVFRRFENLRRRIDNRLDELSQRLRLIEGGKSDAPPNGRLPRPAPPVGHSPVRFSDRELPQAGPTLIAIPDLAEAPQAAGPHAESDLSARHSDVWALAATGASPEEIARQTGQPIGEVELIVGLYRQARSSKGSLDHARSL
jgi:hypothetical protein